LDVKLKADRSIFPEYQKFSDHRFEVQIRSIVQNAWSEIDHKLKYKKQIPEALKRRIHCLAALFELADREFVTVRDETLRLEEVAVAQPASQVQEVENEFLDSFSFLSVMQSRAPNYFFDSVKVDGFVDDIRQTCNHFTVKDLTTAIERHGSVVEDYRNALHDEGFNVNPFTELRHILYLYDRTTFADMLYPRQRGTFTAWVDQDQNAGSEAVAG
jgi:putative GTP pyrophosphokinase